MATLPGCPLVISASNIQEAWVRAVRALQDAKWDLRTLTVDVSDPLTMDAIKHRAICQFARSEDLLDPRVVARTIFPHTLYKRFGPALYDKYNGPEGLYNHIPPKHRRWGTYFRRLTHYETGAGIVNQLDNIVSRMNATTDVLKAAYTAILPFPGSETVRRLGAPCLQYLAFQLAPTTPPTIGLLAVYRNHDFLRRAYGNYWGLANLLGFVARETGKTVGWLTCVSSHAYVDGHKTSLAAFVTDRPWR